MAQVPTIRVLQQGAELDYTPASTAVNAGDVVVIGTIPLVADTDIAVGRKGSLAVQGVFDVPKDGSTFSDGDSVYWNATGNPNGGTAGVGCCTSTASGNVLMGFVVPGGGDAVGSAKTARVKFTADKRTTSLAGAVIADSLTGDLSTFPIAGFAAAQGGSVSVTGGASSTSANAGGAVSIAGGAPGATGVGGAVTIAGAVGGATSGAGGAVTIAGGAGTNNAVGGAYSAAGGPGQGTGNGGAATSRGGASGAGATGNGGAYTCGGGAALSTNGTGGATTVTAGVATGTGTGGSVTINSGASGGASGTAGNITIDCGSAAGGTAGAITIGTANAASVTLGASGVHTVFNGPQTDSIGVSTAAAGSTTTDAGVLPAGTAGVYPTTASDGTKGVRIHASDKVTGRQIFIGNGVSNQIMKVYPPSGGTINGAAADAAYSSASGKGVLITCLSSAGNTWLAIG